MRIIVASIEIGFDLVVIFAHFVLVLFLYSLLMSCVGELGIKFDTRFWYGKEKSSFLCFCSNNCTVYLIGS